MRLRSIIVGLIMISGICIFTGCIFDPATTNNNEDSISGARLFIAETDYTSGLLEWMNLEKSSISSNSITIGSDPVLRTFDGYIYVIERWGSDNILKFDPSKSDESGVIYQCHVGTNWNPMDMKFVSSTKAYITCQNVPKILVFNPSTGSVEKEIDISAYTYKPDSNSTPYANQAALADGKLYVALQRRNGDNPGAPTMILTINIGNDAVEDTISMKYSDNNDLIYSDGILYASNPGSTYESGDGAIEALDVATKKLRIAITETDLGGNPYQIVHKTGTRFYVQNYIDYKDVKVMEIDFATGKIVSTLPEVKNAFGGMCYDSTNDHLYVGECSVDEMGIRIFKNNKQIGEPVTSSKSLPPASLVIVR